MSAVGVCVQPVAMLKAQNDFLTLSPQSEKASARYDQWGM
jgi:hypothetical protein